MARLMFLTLIKLNEPFAARSWARTARVHDTTAAKAAQERALALYPKRDFLDRTLVHLDVATGLAHEREVDQAMHVATKALLA